MRKAAATRVLALFRFFFFTGLPLLSIPVAILGFIISRITIDATIRVMLATVPKDMLELIHDVPRPVDWRVIAGSGEPVLILSGGPGDDCDYMLPVASEVAKYAHAILLEHRGTGRSHSISRLPEQHSRPFIARRSRSTCDAGEYKLT